MTYSEQLFDLSKRVIPGGVSSPVRAFQSVSGTPLFIKSGKGAHLFDEDGRSYIDYVCSWGPLILGHAHPVVLKEVKEALERGLSFGAPTEIELKLAKKICEHVPSIEMVRFVSSGTEAAMSAVRLARGFTKRDKIIKFSGCYHGHSDGLLVAAGSGALTLGVPSSDGVPQSVVEHTLVANFNDLDSVTALLEAYPDQIAAIIVEPIAGNMNLVCPEPGFLEGLRSLCGHYGSLLIFDEVITGFRVGLGGAQAYFEVEPDLTILGKIIGGGMPAAAFGGKSYIMQAIAPLGKVYQAGTLSGNPIAMTAGLATLTLLEQENFYENLAEKSQMLASGLEARAKASHVSFLAKAIGGMFGLFFTDKKNITNEQDVKTCDQSQFKKFFHGMLKRGVYLAPSAFEIGFMSSAHTNQDINQTLDKAEAVFSELD